MSWFNTAGISNLAKSAISQAQKSIDKVLDIKDETGGQDVKGTSKTTSNVHKSKSYTEGYSNAQRTQKYKDEEEDDDGDMPSLKNGPRIPEEDSFFSSFLGSDKHSTPKVKRDTRKKLSSSSDVLPEKLESVTRKQDLENSITGFSKSSTEPVFDTVNDAGTRIEKSKRGSSTEGVKKDEVGTSVRKETRNKDRNDMSDISLKEKDSDIGQMKSTDASLLKKELMIENDDIGNGNVNDVINLTGEKNLKVENDNCDNDDDDSGDYFDASDNGSLEDSKMLEEDRTDEQDSLETEKVSAEATEMNAMADCYDGGSKEMPDNKKTSSDLSICVEDVKEVEGNDVENKRTAMESFEDESVPHAEKNKESGTIEDKIINDVILNGKEEEKIAGENEQKVGNSENDYGSPIDKNLESSLPEGYELSTEQEVIEQCSLRKSEENLRVIETSDASKEYDDEVETKIFENQEKIAEIIETGKEVESGQTNENTDDLNWRHQNSSNEQIDDMKIDENIHDEEIGNSIVPVECISEESNASYCKDEKGLEGIGRESNVCNGSEIGAMEVKEDNAAASQRSDELEKEVKRLKEVVDARESKMVALSKENIDLQEAVSILRNQLQQAEQVESGENEVIREMRDEFAKIVDELRSELKTVKKERDSLRINLEETTERLTNDSDELIRDYTTTLKEKEEQIAGLLTEGEALSKKELKSNNLLKKFRVKVKNLEEKGEQNLKEIEDKDAELVKLKETVKEKNEQEKVLKEQVKKLEMITDQQEDEISKIRDELDDAEDKMKGMQTTLDSGYQEINRLSLERANRESEIEEITQLKSARDELEKKINELEDQTKHTRLLHQEELNNLRLILTRTEQASARREDNLQMEIKDLQHRLEGAESRNQELSQSIASASRPLLRQIENLQSSHQNQAQNWERIEKNLNERLAAAQQQLALVTEKERSAVDFAMEMKSRVSGLELQIKTLRQQKEEITNELEKVKEKSKVLESDLMKERESFKTYQTNYRKALEELQNEKVFIENQLNAELAKHEAEILKISNEYKAKGQLSRQDSANLLRSSSMDGKFVADEVEVDAPPAVTRSRTSSSSSSSNLIDAANRHASTAVMEKLQTQLRQKDGELKVHKEEIATLQKTRASLAQELVTLSNLVEELEEKMNDYDSMKKNYQAVESRYNAALQLYGEKAEEADELRMDLEDIKQMYKQQIQQLIGDR